MASFSASATAATASVTVIGARGFSVKLTFEAVVEGATEVVVEVTMDALVGRERQTSFMSFSSNSAHRGTM
jgi:hypothetical protein